MPLHRGFDSDLFGVVSKDQYTSGLVVHHLVYKIVPYHEDDTTASIIANAKVAGHIFIRSKKTHIVKQFKFNNRTEYIESILPLQHLQRVVDIPKYIYTFTNGDDKEIFYVYFVLAK